MSRNLPESPTDSEADCGDVLVSQLREIIGSVEPASHDERRTRDRFPIFCTLQITPIDSAGKLLTEEAATILGKDLSANGISFSHEYRIRHRRIVVTLIHPQITPFYVEAEITWTRQTPIGLYETGCRLIRKLSDPSAARR